MQIQGLGPNRDGITKDPKGLRGDGTGREFSLYSTIMTRSQTKGGYIRGM
jgi:hypothetical protein